MNCTCGIIEWENEDPPYDNLMPDGTDPKCPVHGVGPSASGGPVG